MARLSDIRFTKWLCLLMATLAVAQTGSNCPNTLAKYNFQERTMCTNYTIFIVPVDTATVAAAVAPYKLLPLPTSNKKIFPCGFPAGKFPVAVVTGLGSDIRMNQLQLSQSLYQGSITVPYVDRLGDGKTPFRFNIKSYVGGVNGADINALVPSLAATAGGTTLFVADFVPNSGQSYQYISPSMPEYFAEVKQVVVPNPVSGPGVYPEAFDVDFFIAKKPQYQLPLYKQAVNQPFILSNGFCQRTLNYWNETFSDPEFRNGSVTLYEPGGAFAGFYTSVSALSVSGGQVGYAAEVETCQQAAANTDPNAF